MQQLMRFLNGLLPGSCLLCGDDSEWGLQLCADCLTLLPTNGHACQQCALPVPTGNRLCGQCLKHPPPTDFSHCHWQYRSPMDRLIHALKFRSELSMARTLGRLMLPELELLDRPEMLIPVPLHPARLRHRGYNQAIELYREASGSLAIPMARHHVVRTRATRPQVELDAKERRRNLRSVFLVRDSLPAHVAILDDVITTGATVNELALTLKRAGVEKVSVWAVARAEGPQRTW
jgi:ComF family protein